VGFDELYQQYFKDIYHYLLGISKDSHLAEEITQETFFKALRSLDSIDGKKDIRAWLFTIAKNTYFSHKKKDRSIDFESVTLRLSDDINFVDNILDEERCFWIHKFYS